MIEDGRVAVTIHWSPPVNSDLPISRYKVGSKYRKLGVKAVLKNVLTLHT